MKPGENAKNGSAGCSRRDFFQNAFIPAAGVGLLLGTTRRAEAKMAQASAGYQDTPKGDQSCSNCSLFAAPASCSLVDGTISPQGWCRFHQTKK